MSAIYRTDSPPGPAGRWLIDHLKQEDALRLQPQTRSVAVISADPPHSTAVFTPIAYAMQEQ
jgi:hypothetical protein